MAATRFVLLTALLALHLAAVHQALAAPQGPMRVRRQLADDNTLQPLDLNDDLEDVAQTLLPPRIALAGVHCVKLTSKAVKRSPHARVLKAAAVRSDDFGDEQAREKRKLEGITQAKFGIKNAVLGFVFGKINSLIDSKTRLVETLDRQNIELNKQYGIEAPKGGGLSSLSGIVGQVIGPKLQLLGPKIQAVSSLFGASSGNSGGSGGGSGLGSILSLVTSLSGSSSGGAAAGGTVETVDSDEDDS
ncbi:hypothetical protein KGM_209044 [Danaus plexippus plexippus]|uniref:Uncharacterized protein n=1 Tax=Danaus plexippus plexippus TaxID=278856 RepID=A0A212FCS5_DANPL|nr:hypothetical protein KGM_209044 [Danaus plexippus plexippus]